MRIVDFLDASSARDVILGNGDLDLGVIRQWQDVLYQTFAEGALSDDHAAVVVLDGTGEDFAG